MENQVVADWLEAIGFIKHKFMGQKYALLVNQVIVMHVRGRE